MLVSGDVGFFSLAKTISGKLPDCECVRYCGISSLVYFSSKLQLSWDDAKIVSMHGRTQNLVAAVARNKKVFSLTGGENSPQKCAHSCVSMVLVRLRSMSVKTFRIPKKNHQRYGGRN